MFRFLIIGDVHYSATPPERRKPGYGEAVLEKLRFAADVGRKLDVDGYIFTGDIFHSKKATTYEINQILRAMTWFESDVHILIGNHDVTGHNSSDLERKGIGALFHLPHVYRIPRATTGDGIRITGSDYCPEYEDSQPYDPLRKKSTGPQIHVTHGLLMKDPLPFEIAQTSYETLIPNAVPELLWVNGHYHKPWEAKKPRVWNVGSLSRSAINETHQPRILVAQWDEKWVVKSVPVPVEEDVWEEESEAVRALDADAISEFVDGFEAEEDVKRRSEEILTELMKDAKPEIRVLVAELLEVGGTV